MVSFIDIHCHLLPGVDDGAPDTETACQLLRMAQEDGTGALVLTPHYRGRYRQNSPQLLRQVFDQLTQSAPEGLELYLGSEVAFEKDIGEKLSEGRILTLNDSRYVLLEFDYSATCRQAADAVMELVGAGKVPIIAHLERYGAISKDRHCVDMLLGMGALIQINADSILGRWGFSVKRFCHWLLRTRRAHFVASDAHDAADRPPKLKACFDLVQKKYGPDYAAALFRDNARVVLTGEPQSE